MKTQVSVAIGILIGLQQLDQQLEKAAPEVRLKIAIMINRLRPVGDAYDNTQARLLQEANRPVDGHPTNPSLSNAAFTLNLAAARAVDIEIEDRKLTVDELNLKENPKINSMTLANILPILEGTEGV